MKSTFVVVLLVLTSIGCGGMPDNGDAGMTGDAARTDTADAGPTVIPGAFVRVTGVEPRRATPDATNYSHAYVSFESNVVNSPMLNFLSVNDAEHCGSGYIQIGMCRAYLLPNDANQELMPVAENTWRFRVIFSAACPGFSAQGTLPVQIVIGTNAVYDDIELTCNFQPVYDSEGNQVRSNTFEATFP